MKVVINNTVAAVVMVVLGAAVCLIGLVNMADSANNNSDGMVTSLAGNFRRRLETNSFNAAGPYKASIIGTAYVDNEVSSLCKEVYVPFVLDAVDNDDYEKMIDEVINSSPALPNDYHLEPNSFEYKSCKHRSVSTQNKEQNFQPNFIPKSNALPFTNQQGSNNASPAEKEEI